MPVSETTNVSPNSVPMISTVSKPSPPSMLIGALIAYSTKSAPSPPLTFEKRSFAFSSSSVANARTVKVSSSRPPFRPSDAFVCSTVKWSSPSPPFRVAAMLIPFER